MKIGPSLECALDFRKKLGLSDVVSAWESGGLFVPLSLFGFGHLTEQMEGGTIACISSFHASYHEQMEGTACSDSAIPW